MSNLDPAALLRMYQQYEEPDQAAKAYRETVQAQRMQELRDLEAGRQKNIQEALQRDKRVKEIEDWNKNTAPYIQVGQKETVDVQRDESIADGSVGSSSTDTQSGTKQESPKATYSKAQLQSIREQIGQAKAAQSQTRTKASPTSQGS